MKAKIKKYFIFGLVFGIIITLLTLLLVGYDDLPFLSLFSFPSTIFWAIYRWVVRTLEITVLLRMPMVHIADSIIVLLGNFIYFFFVGWFIGIVWNKDKSKSFKILASLGIFVLSLIILLFGMAIMYRFFSVGF